MVSIIDEITIQVSECTTLSLRELIEGWSYHVSRLHKEAPGPIDRSTWGMHDYLASMNLRDFIAKSTDHIDDTDRVLVEQLVAAIDGEFESFTENDDLGVVSKAGNPSESSSRNWWWRRIPRQGLARTDFDEWAAWYQDTTTEGEPS